MKNNKFSQFQAGALEDLKKTALKLIVCQVLSHQLHLLQLTDSIRQDVRVDEGEVRAAEDQMSKVEVLTVGDGVKYCVELLCHQVGVDEVNLFDLADSEGKAIS